MIGKTIDFAVFCARIGVLHVEAVEGYGEVKGKTTGFAVFCARIGVLHVEAVEGYGEVKGKTTGYCQKNAV